MDNILPTDALPTDQPTDQVTEDPRAKINKQLKESVSTCKQYKRKLIQSWSVNIDYRRGKPFASQSDEDRISVNLDWSLTKQKQALLFSQVPEIRVNHPPQTTSAEFLPWIHNYEQRINDTAVQAGIETALEECLPDCINAAGIGIVLIARETITEDVEVPAIDLSTFMPEEAAQIEASRMLPDGSELPMASVPRVLDSRYRITRVSPADFLWPIDFTGSDFNDAPWLGRTGRMTWPEAMATFKLNEADKQKYCGGEDRNIMDRLNTDAEKDEAETYEVAFDEVFYKERSYDAKSKSFDAIHHLVFLGGSKKPVIDESWKGQQPDPETNLLVGSLRRPLQVLSLTYITDEAIPPSDSAIGRPQVNELNESRTHMVLQRKHSRPVRWFDVNRIDPTIQQALMKGVWQHMIPVQGNGDNIIGEISRSAMPQENFLFDGIIKGDLNEAWQVGQGQVGTDIETKAEVNAVQGNMQTRIARERAKVSKFICIIAEVLGGLLSIYEDPATIGEGFKPSVSRTLVYSILADSTVLLDSGQRIKRLVDFVNFAAKSGYLNVEPVLKEIATLTGLDPNVVIQPPAPKPPAEPNISLRLTGAEDMMNPLLLAFMEKFGITPDPAAIERSKKLIQLAMMPPPGTIMPTPQQPGEVGPDGQPAEPNPMDKVPIPIAPQPGAADISPAPPGAPPPVGDAHPNWSAMPRINERVVNGDRQ